MTTTSHERMSRARLSAQRALLGVVPPTLRAVVLSVTDGNVAVRCYFDGSIQPEDQESMSFAETEMMADCGSGETVSTQCLRMDAPTPISDDGVWVYSRRERQ